MLAVTYFGNVTSNLIKKSVLKKIKNVFMAEILNAWCTIEPPLRGYSTSYLKKLKN